VSDAASAKRRGLGRGLDALLPGAAGAGSASDSVREVPIGSLRPNTRQPRLRFEDEAIAELTDSIRQQGVLQPLLVTPDRGDPRLFRIVAGERRWRAAQRAGLATVPVVVREVADERAMLELALVENLQRSDLNPMEEAEAYFALVRDFGLKQDEVAGRVGKGRPTVSNALRLLRLPEPVRELLRSGQLSAGQAKPLLSFDDAERQIALAERAVAEGLSARELEALASGASKRPGKSSTRKVRPVEAHAQAAAERLTKRLQTRVEIVRRRGRRAGGQIRIEFHGEEELMRLYDHLLGKGAKR
jgi:ParB family chromosome partitioning protein